MKPLTIFTKCFILNIWQGSKYGCENLQKCSLTLKRLGPGVGGSGGGGGGGEGGFFQKCIFHRKCEALAFYKS